MEQKRVKFIRKNGRIIPIRVKEGLQDVGAGIGVSVASGVAAERTFALGRKFQRQSRIATTRASNSFAAGRIGADSVKMRKAVNIAKKATATFKISRAFLLGGGVLSAGLAYRGLGKLESDKNRQDEARQYARFAIAAGAAGLGAKLFKRGLGKSMPFIKLGK